MQRRTSWLSSSSCSAQAWETESAGRDGGQDARPHDGNHNGSANHCHDHDDDIEHFESGSHQIEGTP